ncbi:MORN repeat-containing protein 3 [Xenentodon cancila]
MRVGSLKQDSTKILPVMPFIKSSKKNPPFSKLKDILSQKCGLRHTVFSVSGNEYTGEWLDNKKHGKGTQVWRKTGVIYAGEWKFGKRDGYGTFSVLLPESKEFSRKYSGEWKNGKKHGYGTYFYNNSAVYEGDWSEDQRSGWGRMHYLNGDLYEGEWINDKNNGRGLMIFSNGNWYDGTWRDGKKNGDGKLFYPKKGLVYEGFWVDGIARCGTLSDFGRNEASAPAKYSFPKLHLVDVQLVLSEAQSALRDQP